MDLETFQSDYKDTCAWEIRNVTAERALLPENDTVQFAVLQFSLKFRRKRVFSSYILTLPCVFLAALTLMVFWLPADRPDRIGLCKSMNAVIVYRVVRAAAIRDVNATLSLCDVFRSKYFARRFHIICLSSLDDLQFYTCT